MPPPFSGSNEPNPGGSSTFLSMFSFPEIYDLVKKEFVPRLMATEMNAKKIFIYRAVPNASGNSHQFNEADFTTFASDKAEGAPVKKAKFGIGYHKIMYMKRIGLELPLTYEARMFNQWYTLGDIIQKLPQTCPQRIDLDLTHRVTFANATSYVDMDGWTVDTTTGDGLSLANVAHTLAFSSQTYSNIVPGNPQFTQSALESAEMLAAYNTFDNFGIKVVMKFSHAFCADTPNVYNKIRQVTLSTADPTQANPAVYPVYKGKYELLILPRLASDANGFVDTSKQYWWGIGAFDGTGGDRFQAYYGEWEAPHMQPAPTESNNANDYSRDIWKFGTRAGYGIVTVSGRGFIISMAS